ncbi:MAG: MFS transporter [Ktedonobacterales bacterium]|nr:MFS transporter [Ktedonobacterales bacterium]
MLGLPHRAQVPHAPPPDPAAPGRAARGRMSSALRYRNYRLFWTGQLISVTGTFMQSTAQQWLVLTLSSNPLDLGIVGALQFGPLLVLAPFGGAIADRLSRRRVLMLTQASAGILASALFLLTATHLVQIWHVFLLALLLGFVNAVDMPTRQAFVSEMVPPKSLLNAVSLNSAQFNASRIVGPGVAGAMIALLGIPILFLLNALSYVAVIVGLILMRPADLMPVPRSAATHGIARLRAIGEGAGFVLRTPIVAITFIMVTVVGIFGFNFNVLLPLEATRGLHAGSAIFGLLSSAMGVGALSGALLLARRASAPTNRLLVGMALSFGILETSIALTGWVPAAIALPITMALFATTGFFMSSFSAAANTRVQLSSPPELRGRVMSVYMMVFAGTTPIGNLLVSGVAGAVGVSFSFIVGGVPCILAALVSAALWRRRARAPHPGQPH